MFPGFAAVDEYARSLYLRNGFPAITPYINCGVFAFRQFDLKQMENIYRKYQPTPSSLGERTCLSFERVQGNSLHELNPRFNVEWWSWRYAVYDFLQTVSPQLKRLCIAQALDASFFLHFSDMHDDLNLFDLAMAMAMDGNRLALPMDALAEIAAEFFRALPDAARQKIARSPQNARKEANEK